MEEKAKKAVDVLAKAAKSPFLTPTLEPNYSEEHHLEQGIVLQHWQEIRPTSAGINLAGVGQVRDSGGRTAVRFQVEILGAMM